MNYCISVFLHRPAQKRLSLREEGMCDLRGERFSHWSAPMEARQKHDTPQFLGFMYVWVCVWVLTYKVKFKQAVSI